MMKRFLMIRLIAAIAFYGMCGGRIEAQMFDQPGLLRNDVVRECRSQDIASNTDHRTVAAVGEPSSSIMDASGESGPAAVIMTRISSDGVQLQVSMVAMSLANRFWLWLGIIVLSPWMLGCLLQSVLRRKSILLDSLAMLCWMIVVLASSWAFWGVEMPFIVFAALTVPAIGCLMPYFAFVIEQLDPMTIADARL